jgi:hypothetical protein
VDSIINGKDGLVILIVKIILKYQPTLILENRIYSCSPGLYFFLAKAFLIRSLKFFLPAWVYESDFKNS